MFRRGASELHEIDKPQGGCDDRMNAVTTNYSRHGWR